MNHADMIGASLIDLTTADRMEPVSGVLRATLPLPHIAPVSPTDAFWRAAEALLEGVEPLVPLLPRTAWPLTFLCGQVLECSLKSFLAARGVSESQLKTVGHDLLSLWSHATALGFVSPVNSPIWLPSLGELHRYPFALRYPMRWHGIVLPHCVELAAELPLIARALANARTAAQPG